MILATNAADAHARNYVANNELRRLLIQLPPHPEPPLAAVESVPYKPSVHRGNHLVICGVYLQHRDI